MTVFFSCLQLRIHQLATRMQLQPFNLLLQNTLDQVKEKDSGSIFAEPVDLEEVQKQNKKYIYR